MPDAYENVVGGKLKLKGKALDVKAASGGITKKKKKKDKDHHQSDSTGQNKHGDSGDLSATAAGGGSKELLSDPIEEDDEGGDADGKSTGDNASRWDDHLTPAERRYVEQKAKIDMRRLAKTADKSHRDRIQDFNQYLANMSEHYDIPKVGPG